MAPQEYSPQRHLLLNLRVYHRIRKAEDDPPPHFVLHYFDWRELLVDRYQYRLHFLPLI